MTSDPDAEATGTTDPISALERAYEELSSVVANIDSEALERPTCCPEWDVRGVLNHTLGGALMYAAVNAGQTAKEDAGDVVGNDPAGALATIAAVNVASWREPGALDGERTYPWGTFPAFAGLVINVGEIAIHAWDLARATGHTARLDPDVAQLVFDLYSQVPMTHMRATGVYGPEIAVPESAPIQDRLLAFLSRDAHDPMSPVVARAAAAEVLSFPGGSAMTLLADGPETGGKLTVHHTTLRNGADGATPHHHTASAEVLYVLSGTVQVLVGDEIHGVTTGDLAVVPPGVTHAFAAAPGSDAEILVALTPGIARFDLFRRFARVAAGAQRADGLLDDQSDYDTYNDDSPAWQLARTGMEVPR